MTRITIHQSGRRGLVVLVELAPESSRPIVETTGEAAAERGPGIVKAQPANVVPFRKVAGQ